MNLDYTGHQGHSSSTSSRRPTRQQTEFWCRACSLTIDESSEGDSAANAGSIRVRKRLAAGVSLGGTFTWSKSLDDASTIGAGSSIVSANGKITGVTVVAQNAFDLSAERGLSSFNQEFRFTGDYLVGAALRQRQALAGEPGGKRRTFSAAGNGAAIGRSLLACHSRRAFWVRTPM